MTTYAFTITFDDGEFIVLQAALDLLEKHCKEQLAQDNRMPYTAYLISIKGLKERLYSDMIETSTTILGRRD